MAAGTVKNYQNRGSQEQQSDDSKSSGPDDSENSELPLPLVVMGKIWNPHPPKNYEGGHQFFSYCMMHN